MRNKLREDLLSWHNSPTNETIDENINELEQIIDGFTINFAEYLRVRFYDIGSLWCEYNSNSEPKTTVELLKIFKEK